MVNTLAVGAFGGGTDQGSVRFSACPMFTRDMQQTELGIEPDVKVDIAPADYARGIDTIIETARRLLKEKTLLNYNK